MRLDGIPSGPETERVAGEASDPMKVTPAWKEFLICRLASFGVPVGEGAAAGTCIAVVDLISRLLTRFSSEGVDQAPVVVSPSSVDEANVAPYGLLKGAALVEIIITMVDAGGIVVEDVIADELNSRRSTILMGEPLDELVML